MRFLIASGSIAVASAVGSSAARSSALQKRAPADRLTSDRIRQARRTIEAGAKRSMGGSEKLFREGR